MLKTKYILKVLLPKRLFAVLQGAYRLCHRMNREGWRRAFKRRLLWGKILATPPIFTDKVTDNCALAVHLMCHQGDYLSAIWALKSFYYYSRASYPLVIRVQGNSPRVLRERLRKHFPNARLVLQQEADRVVEP